MRRPSNITTRRYRARFCWAFTLIMCLTVRAFTVQDIGGTLAFQGQDIVGGAAIIFKPPKRVKDLVGNAAAMMAVKRPARSGRNTDIARNTGRPQPPTQPTTAAASATASTNDRVEELKNQGNTLYD